MRFQAISKSAGHCITGSQLARFWAKVSKLKTLKYKRPGLPALVSHNDGQTFKASHPATDKGLGDGVCSSVGNLDGSWPPCIPIYAGEQIG